MGTIWKMESSPDRQNSSRGDARLCFMIFQKTTGFPACGRFMICHCLFCLRVSFSLSFYIYIYIYIYACMHIYVYVDIYWEYIYIYIYIFRNEPEVSGSGRGASPPY